MSNNPDILIFNETPEVEFASNIFVNVPIILEYGSTPLIEVVTAEQAGFTTQFSIFHRDGTQLAKVKGSRLFLTPDGQKANLTLRHPDKMTVCELDGQTLFEIMRKEAAALKTEAELWTPDGAFIKAKKSVIGWLNGESLQIGNIMMQGNRFIGCRVGIHIDPPNNAHILSQHMTQQIAPLTSPQHVGRNEPCPCGSGQKFKKCCGKDS